MLPLKIPGFLLVVALLTSPAGAAERWSVGLTAGDIRIEAAVIDGASASSPTVLLVGGLHGKDESAAVITRETADFEAIPQQRRPFRLLAISVANPEAHPLQFPPAGVAYKENIESNVLWRWIAIHAPDLVVIAGPGDFGLADALSKN